MNFKSDPISGRSLKTSPAEVCVVQAVFVYEGEFILIFGQMTTGEILSSHYIPEEIASLV